LINIYFYFVDDTTIIRSLNQEQRLRDRFDGTSEIHSGLGVGLSSRATVCERTEFDYKGSLQRISSSRSRRGVRLTKKFFKVLHEENIKIPMINDSKVMLQPETDSWLGLEDVYSNNFLRSFGPIMPGRVAISVSGNGNCLFNSASFGISGKEDFAHELRVRTVIELCAFADFYQEQYLSDKFDEWTGVTYEEAIHEIAVDGGYASVWAICGLASVLQRPIVSVYPTDVNGGNDMIAQTLNRTVHPRLGYDPCHEKIFILWTRTIAPASEQIWRPNHFAPLIRHNQIEIRTPAAADFILESGQDSENPRSDEQVSSVSSRNDTRHTTETADKEVDEQSLIVMKSAKGKLQLGHEGYVYRFDRSGANDTLFLRCVVQDCVGRIKTSKDYTQIEVRNTKHNHAPSSVEVKVREVTYRMREKAATLTETIPAIYRQCASTLANNSSAAALLPTLHNIDSALYRQRHCVMPALCRYASITSITWSYTSARHV